MQAEALHGDNAGDTCADLPCISFSAMVLAWQGAEEQLTAAHVI